MGTDCSCRPGIRSHLLPLGAISQSMYFMGLDHCPNLRVDTTQAWPISEGAVPWPL